MLRQSTYSTTRFGLYNYIAREARQISGQKQLSASGTMVCAGLAGGVAGMIGNPTEVARNCVSSKKVMVRD
jgi:dicarboxylate transporter 10